MVGNLHWHWGISNETPRSGKKTHTATVAQRGIHLREHHHVGINIWLNPTYRKTGPIYSTCAWKKKPRPIPNNLYPENYIAWWCMMMHVASVHVTFALHSIFDIHILIPHTMSRTFPSWTLASQVFDSRPLPDWLSWFGLCRFHWRTCTWGQT